MRLIQKIVVGLCVAGSFSQLQATTILSDSIASDSLVFKQSYESVVDSIITFGKTFIGKPYKYGGTGPHAFDCSGFTSYLLKPFGFNLPHSARAQYHATNYIPIDSIRKGDLVYFEGRKRNGIIGHVGIVVSDSLTRGSFEFLHASTSNGIIVSRSFEPYYNNRLVKASRLHATDSLFIYPTPAEISLVQTVSVENQTVTHHVQKGDTLYSLARKYNLSVEELKKLNGLSSTNIRLGQELTISN